MIEWILIAVLITLATAHIGIAWTLMTSVGNLMDWTKPLIAKIKSSYIQDLLTCAKCVSGQAGLWLSVFVWFYFRPAIDPIGYGMGVLVWLCTVIVLTDQLNQKYGYA